jgi:hypothetical protein
MGNTGQNEAVGPWHQLRGRNPALKFSVPEVFDLVFDPSARRTQSPATHY